MKGISAVLATVLIVVITVAIIGMAYGWATGMFEMVGDTSEEQVSGATDSLSKTVEILTIKCEYRDETHCDNVLTFAVKNTGTKNIASGEMGAFIDNTDIDNLFTTSVSIKEDTSLDAGEVKQFSYRTSDEIYFNTDKEIILKVSAPAGSVEETVLCPELEICLSPINPPNPIDS
ncbi:MAG: hypothetical protein KJ697_00455 [Nanoarchaeota archaeon]|nr:hypothetical protein [Nanoarchaeota archaeon]